MSFQLFLSVIVVCVGGWMIAKAYIKRAREQRLRDNPPEKACFMVRLPKDMNDSLARMDRFYRKLNQAVMTDANLRRTGEGIVSVVWLAHIPKNRSSPEISCLIYCPPEHLMMIKRGLGQVFGGLAEITTPPTDVLADLAKQIVDQDRPAEAPEAATA
ncbi:hypothetical protein [Miltoncostaea oceani]|uniref:hypothetical protein n=1 Tax=Miltoncostaea oceani TaxID=2843216 RepID=UPI001C3DC504|nr:hypothetical protein [Miltoncostaea oceani]